MKSKLITISVLLLSALAVVPVMAKPIGPRRADPEKNPNLMTEHGEVELFLRSGAGHSWMDTEWGVMDFTNWKNASKFKIRKATALAVEDLADMMVRMVLACENRWCYISLEVLMDYVDWMSAEGYITEGQADEMESLFALFPDGMYVEFVNVGK